MLHVFIILKSSHLPETPPFGTSSALSWPSPSWKQTQKQGSIQSIGKGICTCSKIWKEPLPFQCGFHGTLLSHPSCHLDTLQSNMNTPRTTHYACKNGCQNKRIRFSMMIDTYITHTYTYTHIYIWRLSHTHIHVKNFF